jgi:hypothetical protein
MIKGKVTRRGFLTRTAGMGIGLPLFKLGRNDFKRNFIKVNRPLIVTSKTNPYVK